MMTGAEAETLAAALVEKGYVGIVLDRLAKQASEVLGTERSSILVRDREDRRLTIVAASNGLDDELVGSHVPRRAERLESTTDAAVAQPSHTALDAALANRDALMIEDTAALPINVSPPATIDAGRRVVRPARDAAPAPVDAAVAAPDAASAPPKPDAKQFDDGDGLLPTGGSR